MCRSLTYAQRAVRLLERENIHARLGKAPQVVTPGGCSYGVKVRAKDTERAIAHMSMGGIRRGKVFRFDANGKAVEVET